jgi:hypothetical protein
MRVGTNLLSCDGAASGHPNVRETPTPPRKKRLRTGEERHKVNEFSHLAGWTAQLHRKSDVGRALYLLCV